MEPPCPAPRWRRELGRAEFARDSELVQRLGAMEAALTMLQAQIDLLAMHLARLANTVEVG